MTRIVDSINLQIAGRAGIIRITFTNEYTPKAGDHSRWDMVEVFPDGRYDDKPTGITMTRVVSIAGQELAK